MYNDSLAIPTLTKHAKLYHDDDNKASKREIHFRRQVTRRRLVNQTTGPTTIRNALKHKAIKPITVLQCDKPGCRGEAVGTFTCIPRECDDIVTRAWATVYDGNATNTNRLIYNFCKTYALFIHTSKPHDVPPLTGPQLKQVCADATHSAGGLDHFSLRPCRTCPTKRTSGLRPC